MHGTDYVTVAALATLLMAIAGAIGGSWKLSRNTQAVKLYRDIATGWEEKAGLQAAQILELQGLSKVKDAEISALKARVSTLEDIVTQKDEIAALSVKTAEVLAQVASVRGQVRQIARHVIGPGGDDV